MPFYQLQKKKKYVKIYITKPVFIGDYGKGGYMCKVGQTVVYGLGGVMEIVALREVEIGDTVRSYYVLREIGSLTSSETLVPVDNKELTSQMRPLLSREELIAAIRMARTIPDDEWISDNRARAEHFKRVILSGDRVALMLMIRSVVNAGRRRADEGKKNFLSDESAMKRAEKLLYSEISVVMDIDISDVPAFIESV